MKTLSLGFWLQKRFSTIFADSHHAISTAEKERQLDKENIKYRERSQLFLKDLPWYAMPDDQVLTRLEVDRNGLTEAQAKKRLHDSGRIRCPPPKSVARSPVFSCNSTMS